MRRVLGLIVVVSTGAIAGCPETDAGNRDAGPAMDAPSARDDAPGERDDAAVERDDAAAEREDAAVEREDAPAADQDAFVVTDDAHMPPPDAYVAEPCSTPGTLEEAPCGRCGIGSRFCTSGLVWELGPCTEPPDVECRPGTVGTAHCGARCGEAPARCDSDCHWAPTGACVEAGECEPGRNERTADGCPAGATRGRTCSASCGWGMFDACVETPDDFDGDGVPYAMDCDDTNAMIVPGSTRACGAFVCDGTPVRSGIRGTQTCAGPGWTVCERPPTCTELHPMRCPTTIYTETRTCATGGCDRGAFETRSCRSGAWTAWSGCSTVTRPPACDFLVSSCGTCGEGVQVTYCNPSCNPLVSACSGTGCVPGSRWRNAVGCAPGEFREVVCDDACTEGLPGPCIALDPHVDVLLLIDNTGSHAGLVRTNAAVLATELVGRLLVDTDVRVAVATFADYPYFPYGGSGDVPFRGMVRPTSDMAMLTGALASIPTTGGGDFPESGIEALWVAAGGSPHPSSVPFVCAPGLEAGGCWRPTSERVVVMLTDITQHNIPNPLLMGSLVDPYMGFSPLPPGWTSTRDRMIDGRVGFFAIVPSGTMPTETVEQMRFVAREVGLDPDLAVVTYPSGSTDLTAAARAMATNLRAHLGLTP